MQQFVRKIFAIDKASTLAKLTMKYLILLLVVGLANALDVEIVSTTCDESLPVTATVKIRCENSSRCTFGTSAAVFGTSKC